MNIVAYRNLDRAGFYKALAGHSEAPRVRIRPERIVEREIDAGGGMRFNYAAKAISDDALRLLANLAEEQQLLDKYRLLASGEIMNTGEQRKVLHHLLRGELAGAVTEDGTDIGAFYREQQDRFSEFATKVRSGDIVGSTGKPFQTIVQIGIGGSDLGPRALYLALEHASSSPERDLDARFVSNVDPDDPAEMLASVDLESTLFVLVSKSGTTQETLTNHRFVIEAMKNHGNVRPAKHIVAVTSRSSPLASSDEFLDAFFIDDSVGGRYSATSAVGGVILSCAFGPEVFEKILAGAHQADEIALIPDIRNNAALCDAMIGIYERNILGYQTVAVLPYSQALLRFPAHLQQLDMESNGKRVNRAGEPLTYQTGPVVFGEPGTNGQHSFYQLLHQGTDIVPLQFIGFRSSQMGHDVTIEGRTSQQKLNANLAAQIIAFAHGSESDDANKDFPGGRPSSLLYGEELTPRSLGALLSHYENKVMFQGFCWNINSFDQEGVQLGKRLTSALLDGSSDDPALTEYARMIGVDP